MKQFADIVTVIEVEHKYNRIVSMLFIQHLEDSDPIMLNIISELELFTMCRRIPVPDGQYIDGACEYIHRNKLSGRTFRVVFNFSVKGTMRAVESVTLHFSE